MKNKNSDVANDSNVPVNSALGGADLSNKNLPAKQPNQSKKTNPNKVGFFRRIGNAFKSMISEMKKVSWPSYKTSLSQLGIVLAVVFVFLLVLLGVDSGLGALYKLLV
ncbi:MAG: preprotein translocase subunit SecE [Clostridia bacterium]